MSKELDYIADIERENRLLGERCNQLLKDKGELTDQIADIKANCDLAIEGRDVKIMELEQQIEEMKSDVRTNIKWADQKKNNQMYCKLNSMINQWEIEEK